MKPITQLFYRQYTNTTQGAALLAMGYNAQRVSQATCSGLVSSNTIEHKNIT